MKFLFHIVTATFGTLNYWNIYSVDDSNVLCEDLISNTRCFKIALDYTENGTNSGIANETLPEKVIQSLEHFLLNEANKK